MPINNRIKFKWELFLIAFMMASSFAGASSQASEVIQDFASWNGVLFHGKFDQKYGYYLELQNRLNQAHTIRNAFIFRPAFRYLYSPELSFWAGYGWMPSMSPYRSENRLWQQILYQTYVDHWQLLGRFRQDQRWIENTSGVSHRSRFMLRALRFTNENRTFAICGWDEVFFNLNSVTGGPASGFDQNRGFIGVNFALSKEVQLEPGYLNIFVNRPDPNPQLMNHAVAIFTIVNI